MSRAVSTADVAALYASSRAGLIAYARRYVNDHDACEDIVADTYLSVTEIVRRGNGPSLSKLEAYVKICIRNEAFRQGKLLARELPSEFIADAVDREMLRQSEFEFPDTWDAAAAARAFAALPQQYQQVLMLTTIEERRFADVARQLNITEGAVATSAFRARERLRTQYLIEGTRSLPACGEVKIEYLAAFVRNSAPPRRTEKMTLHLSTCSDCQLAVKRMRALTVPSIVIIGMAVTSSQLTTRFWGAATAEASLSPATGPLLVGLGTVAASLLVAAVMISMFPLVTQHTDESGAATESATVMPTENAHETSAIQETQPQPTAERTPESSEALPNGVRSVQWAQAPATYTAGGTDARLLLSIEFDQSTRADDYSVLVTPPPGVSLTKVSAGCVREDDAVRCTPEQSMRGASRLGLQFYAALADSADGRLPDAKLISNSSR